MDDRRIDAETDDGRWTTRNGTYHGRMSRDLEPDGLDRQIIGLLQADGRCSNREIARQLDVPEATIRYRVRRLTESGLLRITALVAPEHLGFRMTVVINVQVQGERVDAVADAIGGLSEVMWLAVTSGTSDIIFTASFLSQEHLYAFLTEQLATLPGVIRSESSIGLRVVKRYPEWALNLTSELSTSGSTVVV